MCASLPVACTDSESDVAAIGSSGEMGPISEGGSEVDDTIELMGGAVNGQCVEPGSHFLDVYSCDTVEGPTAQAPPVTQRHAETNPATLDDPDYEWVLQQVEACACTCCHSEGGAGSYRWSHDFDGAWTDSASVAELDTLGYRSGPSIGAAQNNGFSRTRSALPTTDADRLQAFIDREIARRGG